MPHLAVPRLFEGRRPGLHDAWRGRSWRRVAVTTGVILGHVLLIWLLIAGHAPPPDRHADNGAPIGLDLVGMEAASARPSASKSPVVKPPAVKLDAVVATPSPDADPVLADIASSLPGLAAPDSPPILSDADTQALSQFTPASAQIGAGPACNLTPAVVRDFSQNPVVRQGVSELPAGEKSVANAVQIWDGAWPQETLSGGKALLRLLLVREIAAAPADCLKQVNTGPVFFTVPDGAATVMVAVGSGQWTWGQLVE